MVEGGYGRYMRTARGISKSSDQREKVDWTWPAFRTRSRPSAWEGRLAGDREQRRPGERSSSRAQGEKNKASIAGLSGEWAAEQRETHELQGVQVRGKNVRLGKKDQEASMDFETYICYLWYWRSPEANRSFDVLISATSNHMSILPEVREMIPSIWKEPASQVSE